MCEIELSLREGFRPSPPGPGEDATTGGIPVSCCCRQVAEEKSACFGLLAGFFPTALKGVRRLRSQSPLRSGRGWAGAVQLPISVFTERVCAPLLSSPNLHPHSLKGCHPSQPSPEPAPALSWPQKVWKVGPWLLGASGGECGFSLHSPYRTQLKNKTPSIPSWGTPSGKSPLPPPARGTECRRRRRPTSVLALTLLPPPPPLPG